MKKLSFVFILLFVSASFASFQPKFSARVVNSMILAPATAQTEYGFGKSRMKIKSQLSDKTAFAYETRLDSNFATDYLYFDVMTKVGKLRFGKQKMGVPSLGGGLYSTSAFNGEVSCKGTGVGWSQKIGAMSVNGVLYGGVKAGQTKKAGLKAKQALNDLSDLAVYAIADITNDMLGVGVDFETYVGFLYLAMQGYVESGSDEQYSALYAIYHLGGIDPYVSFMSAISSAAEAAYGASSSIQAGLDVTLNDEVKWNIELMKKGTAEMQISTGVELNV